MTLHNNASRAGVLLAGVLFAAMCAGCSSGGGSEGGTDQKGRDAKLTVDTRLSGAINDFGFRLYGKLAAQDTAGNVFISPASPEMALAMTLNGAKGATRDGMLAALSLGAMTVDDVNAANAQLLKLLKNPDSGVELDIANSLWGRQGVTFDPDFLKRDQDSYAAELRTIDFQGASAADTINEWVDQKTQGRIAKLVDQGQIKDALMVLVNAIYFKGKWSLPFDPKETKDGPFTLADGKQVTVPMMRRQDKFPYVETDQFQAVALPYGERYVQACVVLPKPGVAAEDFAKLLTRATWDKLTAALTEREGTVVLPRFKSDYSCSLKAPLSALGMADAFTDAADLTGIVTPDALAAIGGKPVISDVVHKTALEVNEEGTVAAAATGVIVGTVSAPADPPFTMTVDRPFFLVIRDVPTGVILFMGTIRNPK